MTKLGNPLIHTWTHAALAITLTFSSAAFAQQSTNSDPYSGVSQPPPDSSITSSADAPPAPPAAKPSPAVPAATQASEPPPAAAPQSTNPAPAARTSNPDDGIVSAVPGQTPSQSTGTTSLHTRPNPDDDIVSSIPQSANELAEGTNIRVKLTDSLSTNQTAPGTAFQGEVVREVSKGGSVIIPVGSVLKGRVVSVSQGHHLGPSATLRLRPDMVILPDGTAYHLYGQVAGSQAPGTRTDREGGIQPSSHLVKNSIEYGAAAGTGAVIGAYTGGPMGALVGTAIGAGVVTAHILMQHPRAAAVPAGSIVTFSLTEPMALTPTKN